MDFQTAFNIAAGIVGMLGGWLLNNLFQAQRDLTMADKDLATKVSAIEVLVAGQYVKRDEFNMKIDAMFSKLDIIEDKLTARLSNMRAQ